MAAERRYTVEEFERLADTKTCELLDGVVVEKPGGGQSSAVSVRLLLRLGRFVKEAGLGWMFGATAGFVLFPDETMHVRKPDVSFVRKGRLKDEKPSDGYDRLVPDFAFESVSPGDFADDIQTKIEEYLRAKVPLVWVAYPASKIVLAYRPDGTVQRFAADQPLVAEDLFPGFACPLADLFARV